MSRPYSGMECRDMEKRLDDALQQLRHEVNLVNDELKNRNTKAAKELQQKITPLVKFLDAHNGM
jgi:hypothetical protein